MVGTSGSGRNLFRVAGSVIASEVQASHRVPKGVGVALLALSIPLDCVAGVLILIAVLNHTSVVFPRDR
jgi:hypothetical protein